MRNSKKAVLKPKRVSLRCCEKATTKYCPECGTNLALSAIFQLLRHVRQTAAKAVARVDVAIRLHEGVGDDPPVKRHIEQLSRTAKRWTLWAEELQALIAYREEGEHSETSDYRRRDFGL